MWWRLSADIEQRIAVHGYHAMVTGISGTVAVVGLRSLAR